MRGSADSFPSGMSTGSRRLTRECSVCIAIGDRDIAAGGLGGFRPPCRYHRGWKNVIGRSFDRNVSTPRAPTRKQSCAHDVRQPPVDESCPQSLRAYILSLEPAGALGCRGRRLGVAGVGVGGWVGL